MIQLQGAGFWRGKVGDAASGFGGAGGVCVDAGDHKAACPGTVYGTHGLSAAKQHVNYAHKCLLQS